MITLINTTQEKKKIGTVPACIKSIPHPSLLDDRSTCINRKYGGAMEAVHQTNDKNMLTIALSTVETFSSYSAIVRT